MATVYQVHKNLLAQPFVRAVPSILTLLRSLTISGAKTEKNKYSHQDQVGKILRRIIQDLVQHQNKKINKFLEQMSTYQILFCE
ncbi:unnamed protein product [Paramecium octaurelia]|uniref:Uncharacterized protein n=1 Tax=Paramecium octaurelia TaxID=43137 RepID=A0A8S1YCV1_PAROT|nr:unnamed protein product [Paramecium octaurelia]